MLSSRNAESSRGVGPLRIGLVVPRFGDVVGGAELHGRWLAEKLAGAGHHVEVFTTCALDHTTWRNVLPPGVEQVESFLVRRYPTDERDLGIHGELERAIVSGVSLSIDEEELWLRHGVSSSAMEEDLAARCQEFDAVLALPYLFGTTYFAVNTCRESAILIPCLHDEPYARLGVVRKMLEMPLGIMFNTPPEAEFAKSLSPEMSRWSIVALGFDTSPGIDAETFRRKMRVNGPTLLYVGRREAGKNFPGLIDCFVRYKERVDNDLSLIVVGSGEIPVPRHKAIKEMKIDWSSERDAMYKAATILCQPSTNESLSIVLMQAWLAERPALVHGMGTVSRYHCEQSNAGLWYMTYGEFEEILNLLLANEDLRHALGKRGRAYVEKEYSWNVVLERFHESLGRWLETPRERESELAR